MQHWSVWQSYSTETWTVEVLHYGYLVPFNQRPPVSQDPREVPSCAPGSVRVLALMEEVSKMLQKGAGESVDQPVPGFYSLFFWSRR